jgi:MFS family permease
MDKGDVAVELKEEEERRVVRKLDVCVLPVVMLLYIVAFLDRVNIASVAVTDFKRDLRLKEHEFNVGLSVFYVSYIVLELPMTMAVRRYGPRLVLPTMAVLWSVVTLFTGFVTDYAGMLAVRLLLGATEAGIFPGLNYYISTLYKRGEISKRICMLFVSIALSGAFGGLLAYAIFKMDGVGGKAAWRWLFILEGVMSLVVGLLSYALLPNSAHTAYFLTEPERQIAKARLQTSVIEEDAAGKGIKEAILSPLTWVSGLVQLGANTFLFGFSLFLPTIVNGMGYTNTQVQYLIIPIYLVGATMYFITASLADRFPEQMLYMILLASVPILIGYIILLTEQPPSIKYMATFFLSAGGYIVPGLNITWLCSIDSPRYKRAVAIGLNQTLGNIGGVIAGQIYRDQDSPDYIIGHAVSLASLAFAATLITIVIFLRKSYLI